ncbi:uncharacterized protein LOC143181853 [Calliopsis andreniformis]|uniref:uncharacterized protein LOC143181853 n=1 Tax=Calliopsis andreniformis TaxID=337506 RepID=UPI003FCD8F68
MVLTSFAEERTAEGKRDRGGGIERGAKRGRELEERRERRSSYGWLRTRGKAERRNSKIVENLYAAWPRFSQDLLSSQHFSLSPPPRAQCTGKPFAITGENLRRAHYASFNSPRQTFSPIVRETYRKHVILSSNFLLPRYCLSRLIQLKCFIF